MSTAPSEDVRAVLDELEVRFLLDPETTFGPDLGPEPGHDTPAETEDRGAQPDPPSRR